MVKTLLKWLVRIVLGLVVLVIVLALLGTAYQALATRAAQNDFPPPGQLVDVGGYRLHIYCVGEDVDGQPTVILEQASGGISAAWARVQAEVAETARVCAYDRAGMGWSDRSSEPRDAGHIAAELHDLLQAAAIPGPYVLAGWSFGGLYVRAYAGQYPDEVAGMVLLDSSHPDQFGSTEAGRAQYQTFSSIYSVAPFLARMGVMRVRGLLSPDSGLPAPEEAVVRAFFGATKDWEAQSAEFLALPATAEQLNSLPPLGDMPLFVLSATGHGLPPEMEQLWQDWQNELAALSMNSAHVVVEGATHTSLIFDPQHAHRSSEAILKVVEAVRSQARLNP